jgi:hypothetical protein
VIGTCSGDGGFKSWLGNRKCLQKFQ